MILLKSNLKNTTKEKCNHCNKILSIASKRGTSYSHHHLSVIPYCKNFNINQYMIRVKQTLKVLHQCQI